jgi:Glycerol-3-phosphate dehydrogenase
MLNFSYFQVAVPDVVEAAKDADILVFVVPHQFIRTLCSTLLGKIKPTATGLSLIKVIIILELFLKMGRLLQRNLQLYLFS